jgi:hypothetical protein
MPVVHNTSTPAATVVRRFSVARQSLLPAGAI